MLTPGTYLRKRREAAGITIEQAAALVAGMPWSVRQPDQGAVAYLTDHLRTVEADANNLTYGSACVLRNAFRFNVEVYSNLLLHFYDQAATDIPAPLVCRECACSWHDACEVEGQPCAWAEADIETATGLCTACAAADRPAAPQSTEGEIA